MAFEDMVTNWEDQPPPTQTEATSSAAVVPSSSLLSRSWGALSDAAKYVAGEIANPTPATEAEGEPSIGKKLSEGIVRGVADVVHKPVAWAADNLGIGDGQAQARVADWAKQFDTKYGDSSAAGIGRVVGQTMATAPLMSGAGSLVGRGATMLPGAVGTATRFVTGTAPAEGTVARAVQLLTQGASSGATQAGLTASASPDQPVSDQLLTGALVGGVAGPTLGGLTKAVDVLRGYAGGMRPEVAALAKQAADLGIDIPVTSLSTNPLLKFAASVGRSLPFGGGEEAALEAQRQAQGVIARQMGSTADTLGPAVMKEASTRIGQGYDAALAKIGVISGGAPLATDLTQVAADARRFTDADTVGHIDRAINQVADTFKGGPIDPAAYRSLTNSDGPLSKIEAAAPSAAQPYLADIRDALKARLHDAAPPGVADDLRNLDSQYRAMMTVKPLADKSTVGDIQLGGLQGQVIRQSNKFDSNANQKAFTGGGVLGQVGDIGKQFFGKLPESGTAPRAETFEFAKRPVATALASALGLATNVPLQWALRRPAVAQRIINTSLGAPVPDISRALPYGLLGPIDYTRAVQQSNQ